MTLPLKDLINLAKKEITKDQTELKSSLNEAQQFILSLGIKEGDCKVRASLVYQAYKIWAKKPMRRQAFYNQFSMQCASHFVNAVKFFKINIKAPNLLKKAEKMKINYE